jgi:hypothetical protein
MTDLTSRMTNSRIFPVIDFHAHVVEPDVYDATVNHNVVTGFGERPVTHPPRGRAQLGRVLENDRPGAADRRHGPEGHRCRRHFDQRCWRP